MEGESLVPQEWFLQSPSPNDVAFPKLRSLADVAIKWPPRFNVASLLCCARNRKMRFYLLVTCLAGLAFANGQRFRGRPWRQPKRATCVVRGGDVQGVITLEQDSPNAPVTLSGQISGLQPGLHGFHVHQFGDLSNGCASAGGHFNPFNMLHGAPTDANRHVGDLGNIEAGGNGEAHINIADNQLKLCGPLSIMGRAIVIHAGQDDLGRGGNEESTRTGNAGARVGCCVIGQANMS